MGFSTAVLSVKQGMGILSVCVRVCAHVCTCVCVRVVFRAVSGQRPVSVNCKILIFLKQGVCEAFQVKLKLKAIS